MSANVAANHVVLFHYVLRNGEGQLLDESGESPMAYLHGHDNIVPGLERALTGKPVGAKLDVRVEPADGYGEKDDDAEDTLPLEEFGDHPPRIGEQFATRDDDGHVLPLWVTAVVGNEVHITFNHPLAGETLHFQVEILGVRKATAEELQHGHPHGPDGHHHH
ncbi:MAG: peptidylprolyl isomerase [Myxococcales bacterium]|nr:peptidylprolyl isomerase [Myxococcales bacterium]